MISPTDFKKQLDKRIQDLETVKNIETENETFQHFIEGLNEIITAAIFAFESTDLKKVYTDLKLLEDELQIERKKLNSTEATFLKIKIMKLGIYLQRLLKEKGAKFKKGDVKLKEESLKGKARKYIKEKKFEGVGAGILAASDSPLFLLLGKELDSFIAKKREKKDAKENEVIQEIIEEYKQKLEEQSNEEDTKQSQEIEKQRKELDDKISKGKAKESVEIEKSIKSGFVDTSVPEEQKKAKDERYKRYLARHGKAIEENKSAREIKLPDKRVGGIYRKGEEFRKDENIPIKEEEKSIIENRIPTGRTGVFEQVLSKQARLKKEAEEMKRQMAIPKNKEEIDVEELSSEIKKELEDELKYHENKYNKQIKYYENAPSEQLEELFYKEKKRMYMGEPEKPSTKEVEDKRIKKIDELKKEKEIESDRVRKDAFFRNNIQQRFKEDEQKKIVEKELKNKKAKRIKQAVEEGEISSVDDVPEFMRKEEQIESKEKKEKKGGGLVKKILGGGDEEVSKILYAYLPPIQSNTLRTVELLQKLKNTYESAYDEQTSEERDQTFKEIAENLGIIATGKKLEKGKEEGAIKDNLKSLVPYIGMIGKGLAVVGAFGVGWMIGKKLDELLGITPFIQNIVDDLQGSLDDYTKKSLEKTTTKDQQKRTKELDTLKEKLGTNRFTNKKAYEITQQNSELLNTLAPKEKELVLNKAEAYEKSKNVVDAGRRDISDLTLIPQSARGDIKKMDYFPREDIVKSFNSPIANTSFSKLKNDSIDKFENETADSITGRFPREAIIKSIKGQNLIFNNKKVNIDNLHPEMRNRLLQIADEYNQLTGRKLYINSAYRTKAEQERLYKQNPKRAAKPGTSMHEKGLAVDINSDNVEELKKLGLIRKYNFDTPVRGEPWHVEPTNARQIYNSMIEEQKLQAKTQIGDRINTGRDINNIENRETTNTNNSMAFAQNNYVVSPSDFRTFIDDPFLFHEFRNDYS